MTTLGAYIIARNEKDLIQGCVARLLPFVDELLLVDHGSTDGTTEALYQIEKDNPKKVVVVEAKYEQPIDMGALRTNCYQLMRSDWVLNVDADEYYPAESMELIRQAIENPGQAISFRVKYINLAWRPGYKQANFDHAPDRLYRRDVVDFVGGLLPNDMHHVKREFYTHRPFLEYDNAQDQSFENPVQPILKDVWYFHLARTRGYNFEYTKWFRYQKNLHPGITDEEADRLTRINQWVSGLYEMEPLTHKEKEAVGVNGLSLKTIPNPKVSIIIPNFQYRDYVGEAIDSCVQQTVPPHEVIVVDDGSHDDSVVVIQRWIDEHEGKTPCPVRLIKQPKNHGVATARNVGISQSTGDYFVCLDADDELHPEFLEKTLARMQQLEYQQVVYTDLEFFGEQQGTWQAPNPSVETMRQWQIVPSTCALVDRHCFEACGGFDPFVVYEDWEFWCKLMIKHEFGFVHEPLPLFRYRKHGPSRINLLDQQQALGFQQLRDRYGVTRHPDHKG